VFEKLKSRKHTPTLRSLEVEEKLKLVLAYGCKFSEKFPDIREF